jgi:hypothetical protein
MICHVSQFRLLAELDSVNSVQHSEPRIEDSFDCRHKLLVLTFFVFVVESTDWHEDATKRVVLQDHVFHADSKFKI